MSPQEDRRRAERRWFALGCLVVPVLIIVAALALRATGRELGDVSDQTLEACLFALGCAFFATRVRSQFFGGASETDAPTPRGLVTIVRFVILGCGGFVPAVNLLLVTSYWPLAAA